MDYAYTDVFHFFVQFMALYSRLIKNETSGAGSDRVITKLKDQLQKSEQEKARVQQTHEELKRNALNIANQNTIYQQDIHNFKVQNQKLADELQNNPELFKIQKQLTETNRKCTELSDELLQAQHREKNLEEQNNQYMLDLGKLQEAHSAVQASMQQLSDANRILYLEVEQHNEVLKQNEDLQQNLQDAEGQIKVLENTAQSEQAEHAKLEEELRREIAELKQQDEQRQQQFGQLQQELHTKTDRLTKFNEAYKRGYEEHKKDREVLVKLHAQNKALKEKQQKIITEYRSSPELVEEIAAEFDKGFQAALKRIQVTGTDPKSVGFSDDDLLWLEEESDVEANKDAPPPE